MFSKLAEIQIDESLWISQLLEIQTNQPHIKLIGDQYLVVVQEHRTVSSVMKKSV